MQESSGSVRRGGRATGIDEGGGGSGDRGSKGASGRSWASSPGTRATMRANRGRDTGPELAVRRALHGRGYRFRVDHPLVIDRRRRGDIVFTRRRVVVFIDGCF